MNLHDHGPHPMTPHLITAEAVPPTPWRNGGGRTRELLTWPDATDWALRISVADIDADGPFSSFPGAQRWFTVIEGGPLSLEFPGRREWLDIGSPPCRFAGDDPPVCRLLDGPTRDLNLMIRHGQASLAPAIAHEPWTASTGFGSPTRRAFFSIVAGVLHRSDGDPQPMPALALLWLAEAGNTSLRFEPDRPGRARVGWWIGHSGDVPGGTSK